MLLFCFVHRKGALAGRDYWATPDGTVEAGESFEEAALRELRKETGIRAAGLGAELDRQEFELTLTNGVRVLAQERFYRIDHDGTALSREGWSEEEVAVIAEHRSWSAAELAATSETIYPVGLAAMLERACER